MLPGNKRSEESRLGTNHVGVAPASGQTPRAFFRKRNSETIRRDRTPLIERRTHRRYPVDLTVQYEVGCDSQEICIGLGRVVNMSSGGILLEPGRQIAPGQKMNLKIEWPVRLDDEVPLALHIEAVAVRECGGGVAVKILRSAFRTRSLHQTVRILRAAR